MEKKEVMTLRMLREMEQMEQMEVWHTCPSVGLRAL